jgi:hypothetical protein
MPSAASAPSQCLRAIRSGVRAGLCARSGAADAPPRLPKRDEHTAQPRLAATAPADTPRPGMINAIAPEVRRRSRSSTGSCAG